ncbi:MAG: ABC transporter substrate-binding protein [Chloroflexota bacterium]
MSTFRHSRRMFLGGALGASIVGVLTACGQQQAAPSKPSESKPADAKPAAPAAAAPTAAPAAKPAAEAKPAQQAAPAAGKAGGNLTYGLSADPPNLDPHVDTGAAAMTVKQLVYNTLVRYNAKGEIIPDLAESWTTPDDKTYVFKLRKGAKFHDGTELTAEDVKASYARILEPKTGARRRANMVDIKEVVADDANTVRLVLNKPNAPLMANLARPEAAILSKKFLESSGDPNVKMVGTGPFKLASREPGVKLILEKNADYFRSGLPKLDKITFVPYPDENTRVTALKAGDVDIIDYLPWKDTAPLQGDPKIDVHPGDESAFMTIIYNVRQKPFDDPRVRRAFGYAVNKKSIVDAVFYGRGSIMTGGLIPKSSWAYDASLENTFPYDPEKAKALLKEAGYGDGLKVKLLSTSQYGMHQGSAEIVQNDLKKIGVQVDLELYDWPTTVDKYNKQDFQFRIHGLGADILDPDFMSVFFYKDTSHNKSSGFSDPQLDTMFEEARATADQAKRKAMYAQIERRIMDASPFTYLAWREQSEATNKKVKGYQHFPAGLFAISSLSLEEVTIDG